MHEGRGGGVHEPEQWSVESGLNLRRHRLRDRDTVHV